MANVILFHSVLGLRKAVLGAAAFLRKHGHTVYTPDLYRGEVFDDMEQALERFFEIGIPEIMARTIADAKDMPADAVYAGFSNGGASALLLAGTKPGASGCLLLHAALPPAELGIDKWPQNVPVEVHYATEDPWKEQSHIEALEKSISEAGAAYHYYSYPVSGHLFTDEGMPEYNREASELLWQRVLDFLDRVQS